MLLLVIVLKQFACDETRVWLALKKLNKNQQKETITITVTDLDIRIMILCSKMIIYFNS